MFQRLTARPLASVQRTRNLFLVSLTTAFCFSPGLNVIKRSLTTVLTSSCHSLLNVSHFEAVIQTFLCDNRSKCCEERLQKILCRHHPRNLLTLIYLRQLIHHPFVNATHITGCCTSTCTVLACYLFVKMIFPLLTFAFYANPSFQDVNSLRRCRTYAP
jgi:hypothetical protein